ncbi:hypothetical protein TNIN_302881 [Trichonephila inaurata madagascariensis]|uniref:Uncharacterized protein n=1 Tax=Trichonephila inaurata madagascariensis TaxID=2747483 RepID=A0A8X6Y9Y4_9ARAC|nr:hypothetical protein TNIN_302881 [Trichonephila inaurata madagascariensis]
MPYRERKSLRGIICVSIAYDQHRVSKCKSKHSCSECGFHITLYYRQKGKFANALDLCAVALSPLQGQPPTHGVFTVLRKIQPLSCTSRSKTRITHSSSLGFGTIPTGSCIQALALILVACQYQHAKISKPLRAPQNRVNFPISSLDEIKP